MEQATPAPGRRRMLAGCCACTLGLLIPRPALSAALRSAVQGRPPRAKRIDETNAWLRRQDRRVARHSYHLDAKAADVRLPGGDGGRLLQAALELRRGGIGYYPRRDFVHLDTGPVRAW